jgi:hypothetical protein
MTRAAAAIERAGNARERRSAQAQDRQLRLGDGDVRALASHLGDQDFIAPGSFPKWATGFMSLVERTVNRMPGVVRNAVYTVSGWTEAVAQRKIVSARMVVESFILMDPHRTWRAGLVPFWMFFNMLPSLESLDAFLDARSAFDEIGMMLFSHGVRSIGLAGSPASRTGIVHCRKRTRGYYIGVDTRAYPRGFATFVDYSRDLERHFGSVNLDIPTLPYARAREFIRSHAGTRISWNDL